VGLLCVPVVLALTLAAPAQASGGGGGGGGGGSVTPSLASLTFSPATVIGGGGDTATATFATAASQGAVVRLTSSDPAVVSFGTPVPEQDGAVVPPGHTSVAFSVITTAVSAPDQVTITASAFGTTTISAVLTVNPGTPPAPDTVRVTQFQWNKGHQSIQATDSNPNAVLNVFAADGTWLGITLTNQGGGRYQDQRGEVFPPDQPIVVESNFGGSGTATATISN
jgi:hypothetical protein